jgi:hypothetical protein
MNEECYEIESVSPAEPPQGMDGTNWHCYIIVQGANKIRGFRQGNRKAVTEAVEEIVLQLNERRGGKRGRVHVQLPSAKKQAESSK